MNETPAPDSVPTDDDALKRRLLNRIAVAAVIVVGLLGSLAMFDVIFAPTPSAPAKMASLPPKDEAPAAAEPATPPVAESKPAEPVAGTESAAAVKADESPVAERTASPDAPPLQARPAERPLTRPATGRLALMRPAEPVPAAASPAAKPDPARELTGSHANRQGAPASRPISGAAERQFALQMGVFGNLANAEDLRAKLELHGIPSSIEARVHAGPFRTREEADRARAKLKELGLDGGLLVTAKAKSP